MHGWIRLGLDNRDSSDLRFSLGWGSESWECPQGLFTSFSLERPDHQRTTNEVCSHVMIAKNHVICLICEARSLSARAGILSPRVSHHRKHFFASFWNRGTQDMADNSTESQSGMSQSRDSRTTVLSAGCFRVVGEIWNCCQRAL